MRRNFSPELQPELSFIDSELIVDHVNETYQKYRTECMEYDPLLCVEWNETGLLDRYGHTNSTQTKTSIVDRLNMLGTQVKNSTTLWIFPTSNDVTAALHQLVVTLPWMRHRKGHPDVCRTFLIQADRKDSFITTQLHDCNI